MLADISEFGDQFLGPSVEEATYSDQHIDPALTIRLDNKEYCYKGPSRLVMSQFHTKIFNGDIPKNIEEILAQLDGLSNNTILAKDCGYHFFHAEDGIMTHQSFQNIEEYKFGEQKFYGEVVLGDDGCLMYYPNGNRKVPIDFSVALK